MKLEHLEYFTAIARCGSINRAARQLYVSQPHLSRIIKDIEEEAGVALLERRRQGVVLTPEGEVYLQHAQRILEDMARLNAFGKQRKTQGVFNVSMTRYSHIMEAFIDICVAHQDDGHFSYSLSEGTPLEVVGDIAAGTSEIGVLHSDRAANLDMQAQLAEKGLVYTMLAVAQPHIILSARHPLVQGNHPINFETLKDYGFVRYLGKYEDFNYRFTQNGQPTHLSDSPKTVRISSRATLLHLLATGNFYTVGIQDFEQQRMYDILSLPIPGIEEGIEFGYIARQKAALSPIAGEFVARLSARLSGKPGSRQDG